MSKLKVKYTLLTLSPHSGPLPDLSPPPPTARPRVTGGSKTSPRLPVIRLDESRGPPMGSARPLGWRLVGSCPVGEHRLQMRASEYSANPRTQLHPQTWSCRRDTCPGGQRGGGSYSRGRSESSPGDRENRSRPTSLSAQLDGRIGSRRWRMGASPAGENTTPGILSCQSWERSQGALGKPVSMWHTRRQLPHRNQGQASSKAPRLAWLSSPLDSPSQGTEWALLGGTVAQLTDGPWPRLRAVGGSMAGAGLARHQGCAKWGRSRPFRPHGDGRAQHAVCPLGLRGTLGEPGTRGAAASASHRLPWSTSQERVPFQAGNSHTSLSHGHGAGQRWPGHLPPRPVPAPEPFLSFNKKVTVI